MLTTGSRKFISSLTTENIDLFHEAFPSIAKIDKNNYFIVYRNGSSHVDSTGSIWGFNLE